MQRVVVIVGAVLAYASAGAAQGWIPASSSCGLKPAHSLVDNGIKALRKAAETKAADERTKQLQEASRLLAQAVSTGGQEKNPAAWYYLARYYGTVEDFGGADSAFARAAALKPECDEDIAFWRRQLWVPVVNAGIAAWQAGDLDSAILRLRQANAIYRDEPHGFIYLATLYANSGEGDSSARYFRMGIEGARDPKYADARREASYNLARVLHGAGKWDEAAAAYHEYLAIAPNDAQAVAGLASVYSAAGKEDSAVALYQSVLDRADSVEAIDLFQAGVALFRQAPAFPDTAQIGGKCRSETRAANRTWSARRVAARCDSLTVKTLRGHDESAGNSYRLAAQAFETGLARNPHYRDALFNLTNTYFALRDTAKMLPAAQRLYTIDPMNRMTLRLVAQGWYLRGQGDSTLYYLVVADSVLPVEVTVTGFGSDQQGAAIEGMVSNFRGKASEPFTVVFEFVNENGQVVATHTVAVPAVEPQGVHQFEGKVTGTGIAAWRYKRG